MWRLFFVLAFLVAVLFPQQAWAADFDYEVNTRYSLSANDTVSVRTIIDVKNNVSTPTPSTIVLPVAAEASSIDAAFQDGGAIQATYGAETQSIRLQTANQAGQGRQWSLVINYEVDALSTIGDTRILSIPPLDYGDMNVTREDVSISTDLSLGLAVARGPEPDSTRIIAGQQILRWIGSDGPLTDAVGILFGSNGVAEVRTETTLKNNSWWWQDLTMTLPADTNQQQVFLQSIEPQPSSMSLDVDGNILAHYRLRPQDSVSVTAVSFVVVNNFTYNLDLASSIEDTPQQIRGRYLSTNDAWPALEKQTDEDVVSLTKRLYLESTTYELTSEDSYDQSLEAANRLIGALRSSDVPARLVLGYVYGDGGQVFDEPQKHAWLEAYVAGVGWITLDPLFERNGDYFGTTDVQRVALMLRGIDPNYPPEFLDATSVRYTENDVPTLPDMKPQLSATKYMILPGLAVQSVSATLPSGIIVDGNGLQIDGQSPTPLGSLAPLQTATLRGVALGPGAFSGDTVNYGLIADGGINEALASTTYSVNYLPMIIILSLIALFFAVRFILHRRGPKKDRPKRSKDAVVFASEDDGTQIEEANLLAGQGPPAPPIEQPAQQPAQPDQQTAAARGDTMAPQNSEPQRPRRHRIQ